MVEQLSAERINCETQEDGNSFCSKKTSSFHNNENLEVSSDRAMTARSGVK